jgi:hypothetical protein
MAETIEDEFLALVCADEQLLQLEFDAIVSAQWADPPPDDSDGGLADEPAHVARTPESGTARPPTRPRHPGVGGWARQRSPPRGIDNRTRG